MSIQPVANSMNNVQEQQQQPQEQNLFLQTANFMINQSRTNSFLLATLAQYQRSNLENSIQLLQTVDLTTPEERKCTVRQFQQELASIPRPEQILSSIAMGVGGVTSTFGTSMTTVEGAIGTTRAVFSALEQEVEANTDGTRSPATIEKSEKLNPTATILGQVDIKAKFIVQTLHCTEREVKGCMETFKNMDDLEKHLAKRDHHINKFRCPQENCRESFRVEDQLLLHKKKHWIMEVKAATGARKRKRTIPDSWTCQRCLKKISNKSKDNFEKLRTHFKESHYTGIFVCTICEQKTNCLQVARKHFNICRLIYKQVSEKTQDIAAKAAKEAVASVKPKQTSVTQVNTTNYNLTQVNNPLRMAVSSSSLENNLNQSMRGKSDAYSGRSELTAPYKIHTDKKREGEKMIENQCVKYGSLLDCQVNTIEHQQRKCAKKDIKQSAAVSRQVPPQRNSSSTNSSIQFIRNPRSQVPVHFNARGTQQPIQYSPQQQNANFQLFQNMLQLCRGNGTFFQNTLTTPVRTSGTSASASTSSVATSHNHPSTSQLGSSKSRDKTEVENHLNENKPLFSVPPKRPLQQD